jgi:hypothetical protein
MGMEIKTFKGLLPNNLFNNPGKRNGVVLHHTVGGTVSGAVNWWNNDKIAVATPYIIAGYDLPRKPSWETAKNGEVYQTFDPHKHWSYGLGLKKEHLKGVDRDTVERSKIQIELVNWGQLSEREGKFYTMSAKPIEIPTDQVVELDKPFRGFRYWHRYSPEQLSALFDLLHYVCGEFGIVKSVFGGAHSITPEHFLLNSQAQANAAGIWSHGNYRQDKFDVCPQPELIYMLNSL